MKRTIAILILSLAAALSAAAQHPSGPTITLKGAFGSVCCVPGQLVWAERLAPHAPFRVEGDGLWSDDFPIFALHSDGTRTQVKTNYPDTRRIWFTIGGNVRAFVGFEINGPGFSEQIFLAGFTPRAALTGEGAYAHPFVAAPIAARFGAVIDLPDSEMFVFNLYLFASGLNGITDWRVEITGPVSDTVPAVGYPLNSFFGYEHIQTVLPRLPNGVYTLVAFPASDPSKRTAPITKIIQ